MSAEQAAQPQLEPVLVGGDDTEPMEVEVVRDNGADVGPDPLSGEYTWTIPHFLEQQNRLLSDTFDLGGYSWQVLCFPNGNNSAGKVSLYLSLPQDADDQAPAWQRSVSFRLSLEPHDSAAAPAVKEARHIFHSGASDWGFTAFVGHDELQDVSRALLSPDGTAVIKVWLEVLPPAEGLAPAPTSRQDTGYVGLKNQGATCYMNSLLQTLYNINRFRQAVYHMPTSEDEDPAASMPLALQSVFYKLQFTDGPVSTKDLTRSFGWDSADAFQQHDVQELNRILCDRLEEKMKGTRVEGLVNQLFEGHTLNYIRCINVDYKSSRRESFMDLQLDVKGCRTIYDSFDKYCEVETLEGENKYLAEGHGLQDARKGVLFEGLPPVLQLQLKRFEYDFHKDTMVKVNDRYEFAEEIDLDREGRKYHSPGSDARVRNAYRLLAVLVHSGGVHGGHYYAYIRPDGQQWLKFDDERVERADTRSAVESNWGADAEPPPPPLGGGYAPPPPPAPYRLPKSANAYMLVYVRESEWGKVMCGVSEEDIGEHVRARLKAEQEEKDRRRRERAEAHMFTLVRVAADAHIAAQVGSTRFFDLVDFEKVECFKMLRKARFSELVRKVQAALGVPAGAQRYWRWAARQNATLRPSAPLALEADDPPISTLIPRGGRGGALDHGELSKVDLYLQDLGAAGAAGGPGGAPQRTHRPGEALLFFKQYHPDPAGGRPRLAYAFAAAFPKSAKMQDLHPVLRRRGGLPEGAPLLCYEEIKSEPAVMVEAVEAGATLASTGLEDGDIIIFQQAPAQQDVDDPLAYADAFMAHVRNRLLLRLRPLADQQAEGFVLELGRDTPYEAISAAAAQHLGLDHPLKLRFTALNPLNQMPRNNAMRWRPELTLGELVRPQYPQVDPDTLFYEELDLPLPEWEKLVDLDVAFHDSQCEQVGALHKVRLPRSHTVHDLLEALRAQLPADAHNGEPLRLMDVYQWNIWQVYDPAAPAESARDGWHLRAEVVPPEERALGEPGALHVQCVQVLRDNPSTAISDPFLLALAEGETVGEIKRRVRRRLDVPADEFDGWSVLLCGGMAAAEELPDDAVLAERLPAEALSGERLYGHHGDRPLLGFSHDNKNPRKTHSHLHRNSTWYGQERQLKIRA